MKTPSRGPALLPVPPGLSARSRRLWADYGLEYDFARHELDLFERALRAEDLVEQIGKIIEAEGVVVDGKPHAMLASLRDARQTSLRLCRALKFKGEDEKTRRPGRPSGDDWSPKRKAGAALRVSQERQRA